MQRGTEDLGRHHASWMDCSLFPSDCACEHARLGPQSNTPRHRPEVERTDVNGGRPITASPGERRGSPVRTVLGTGRLLPD